MHITVLTIDLHLFGCSSLKDKRSRLKPLISRLQREFNIAVAEVDYHESWQKAQIACVTVSNSAAHNQRLLQQVLNWIESSPFDIDVISDQIEQI